MKVIITREMKKSDIDQMLRRWESTYGSLSALGQKVLINKCTSPDMVSDYVLWKNLSRGAEFRDMSTVETPGVFDALSTRRVELLQYLVSHDVPSIKKLAELLHRDYKNVYDDVRALAEYGLVELVPAGRALRPSAAATHIEVVFGD